MDNKKIILTEITAQNYLDAMKNIDKIVQLGNKLFIVNKQYDEIKDMVPQPVPKNPLYKRYELHC